MSILSIKITKKTALFALLFITLPIQSMDIFSSSELEKLSEEEQPWGNPGALPGFNRQHNGLLVFNPMRGFADSRDSIATSYYQDTAARSRMIISMQHILIRPDIVDSHVRTLTIINIRKDQHFTREQRARVAQLYPQVSHISLFNSALTAEEILEFASHFHHLASPINTQLVASVQGNPSLSEAWSQLVHALETTQATQEELSVLLSNVFNYLALSCAVQTHNVGLVNALIPTSSEVNEPNDRSLLDLAIHMPTLNVIPLTQRTGSFEESLTQLTSEVESFLGEFQENCPRAQQEYNQADTTRGQLTVSYSPDERHLAAVDNNGQVQIYSVNRDEQVLTLVATVSASTKEENQLQEQDTHKKLIEDID